MNSYFQFKQFTVHQQLCAMKVCTDSCLFGAFVAANLNGKNILDIGSGTGLLGLMLAQTCEGNITAVELDANAYEQSKQNFAASPWQERLHIIQGDITQVQLDPHFDLIISNPPFFENDLRSDDHGKNAAKHDTTLTLDALMLAVDKHLSAEGKFAVLLPYHRKEEFITTANNVGFHLTHCVSVKQTPRHNYFRVMMVFSKTPSQCREEEITIKEKDHYTAAFTELLQPYYLNL